MNEMIKQLALGWTPICGITIDLPKSLPLVFELDTLHAANLVSRCDRLFFPIQSS
jgi:hypothetical protein